MVSKTDYSDIDESPCNNSNNNTTNKKDNSGKYIIKVNGDDHSGNANYIDEDNGSSLFTQLFLKKSNQMDIIYGIRRDGQKWTTGGGHVQFDDDDVIKIKRVKYKAIRGLLCWTVIYEYTQS